MHWARFICEMGFAKLMYRICFIWLYWTDLYWNYFRITACLQTAKYNSLERFFPFSFSAKININQNQEVQILLIFVFWPLLLKIQTTITLSILRVRGPSLDSRELSTIPFNRIPFDTKNENTKQLLVHLVVHRRTYPKKWFLKLFQWVQKLEYILNSL